MTTDNRLEELQIYVGQLVDAFHRIDTAFLLTCTPEERALQAEIRSRLHEYIDQIWDEPKQATRGEVHPANLPEYAGVGALSDLAMALWTTATEAQSTAGDDTDSIDIEITVTRD